MRFLGLRRIMEGTSFFCNSFMTRIQQFILIGLGAFLLGGGAVYGLLRFYPVDSSLDRDERISGEALEGEEERDVDIRGEEEASEALKPGEEASATEEDTSASSLSKSDLASPSVLSCLVSVFGNARAQALAGGAEPTATEAASIQTSCMGAKGTSAQ